MTIDPNAILFLDANRGVYIPRDFAKMIAREFIVREDSAVFDALNDLAANNGDDADLYWDNWSYVLDNLQVRDADGVLWSFEQDGDLWQVPVYEPEDTPTKEVVAGMLRENTGTHFLDSGSAYGRNWQRNAARDFDAEPTASVEFRTYRSHDGQDKLDCSYTRNVYHFLCDTLAFDPEMDARFQWYVGKSENSGMGWLEMMDAFAEAMGGTGIYGDGAPVTVNTYNGEDALSQTLQYTYFEVEGQGDYVLLQVHGGCDVRGGYTAPRVFTCTSELSIMDNARGDVWEEGMGADGWSWSTDDAGSHWYGNSHRAPADMIDGERWAETPDLHSLPVTTDVALKGDGVHLYIDAEEDAAYSPRGHKIVAA